MSELEALKQFIAEETTRWADDFISQRKAFLRRRKIEASGDLIDSLESEINSQARREAVELVMGFPDYGRIIDMRRFQPAKGGDQYIKGIEDWIVEKGFRDKFIRGFLKRRNLKTVPNNVLNQIAWGIVKKRATGKYRNRRWYNKPISGAVTGLFNQVAGNMPDILVDQIKEKFKNQ